MGQQLEGVAAQAAAGVGDAAHAASVVPIVPLVRAENAAVLLGPMLKFLLDGGACLQRTRLLHHLVSHRGPVSLTQLLKELGDDRKLTPLHLAVSGKNEAMVAWLLSESANKVALPRGTRHLRCCGEKTGTPPASRRRLG